MDAPISDRSRSAARKLLLIAAALMPAFGVDARAQDHRPFFPPMGQPIEDADPAIRHKETIQIPSRLVFTQSDGVLSVAVDPEGYKPVEISVGLKMIVGTRCKTIVYPATEPRSANPIGSTLHMGGADMSLLGGPISYMLTGEGGPLPGNRYNVELIIEVFETNLSGGHFWMPEGHKFKVLFTKTIKGIATLDREWTQKDANH